MYAQRRPTLTGGDPQLPSAQKSLTSVFGMGTGVASLPSSLDSIFLKDKSYYTNSGEFGKAFFKSRKLVPSKLDTRQLKLETNGCWLSPRSISIRQLHVSPRVHLEPIYLIVFEGSYLLAQWEISS
jgi:hypothetical protein